MTVESGGRPWQPQPGETPRAFDRFRRYLEQGPGRSIHALAQELGIGEGRLYDLSAKQRWRERALAYDADGAKRRDEAVVEDHQELSRRRLQRAKEADMVGRVLTRAGLQPGQYAGEILLDPGDCLKYGERFSRFATELEDRVLVNTPERASESIAEELLGLDDAALRHLTEAAAREDETESHGGERP